MTEPPWIQISPISPGGSALPAASTAMMVAPGHGRPTLSMWLTTNCAGIMVEGEVVSVAP